MWLGQLSPDKQALAIEMLRKMMLVSRDAFTERGKLPFCVRPPSLSFRIHERLPEKLLLALRRSDRVASRRSRQWKLMHPLN